MSKYEANGADGGGGEATPGKLRHGVAGTGRAVVPHAIVEHLPDDAEIGRVAADQLRADLVVQQMHQRAIAAGTAGGVLALAPADKPVIGVDAQDGGIEGGDLAEIATVLTRRLDRNADPPGLDAFDAHVHPRPCRRPGRKGKFQQTID